MLFPVFVEIYVYMYIYIYIYRYICMLLTAKPELAATSRLLEMGFRQECLEAASLRLEHQLSQRNGLPT